MWTVLDLMLWASAVKTPLDRVTLPGVMPCLPASVAGHPKPSIGVLASTCSVVRIVVSVVRIVVLGRPLIWLLRVEAPLLILFPFNFASLIEVVVSFL